MIKQVKLIWITLFVVFLWSCKENKDYNEPPQQNNNIVIGMRDTIFSSILNEQRELIIHVPSEYKSGYPEIAYPVIYVLDPEPHFLSIVAIMDRMSVNIGEELCPQMIVVGIKNTNRIRDMFPVNEEDRFDQFLEQELIPFIDDKYPTKPFRILTGHSLTGLRTVHTAIFNRKLFNSYIAIEPSLCHEYCRWFEQNKQAIDTFTMDYNRMFLAMAHTMPAGMDTAAIKQDTSGRATHMNAMMYLSRKMLQKNRANDPKFKWKYYPTESHNSVTLQAFYDGLKATFDWYKFNDYDVIFSSETTAQAAVSSLQNHYNILSERLGYQEAPSKKLISTLITYLQNQNMHRKAFEFAKLNVVNYPESEGAKNQLDNIEKTVNKPTEKIEK